MATFIFLFVLSIYHSKFVAHLTVFLVGAVCETTCTPFSCSPPTLLVLNILIIAIFGLSSSLVGICTTSFSCSGSGKSSHCELLSSVAYLVASLTSPDSDSIRNIVVAPSCLSAGFRGRSTVCFGKYTRLGLELLVIGCSMGTGDFSL